MAVTHDETARMAQTLRAMASRTGNAAAENAVRDAAQYLVAARKCGNYLVLERTDRRAAP